MILYKNKMWLKPHEIEQIELSEKYENELNEINGLLLIEECGIYKLIYCTPGTENTEMILATSPDLIISVILYLYNKYK